MPGDPLRAKYAAETFLTGPVCYTEVPVRDVVIAMTAGTDSAQNRLRFHGADFALAARAP